MTLYAAKIGPVETDEGRAYAYLGVLENGKVAAIQLASRDRDALPVIAAAAAGEVLQCEPRLARAGAAFGFEGAPMPAWVLRPRAALAAVVALGPERFPGNRATLAGFFERSRAFLDARPWVYWNDDEPLTVTLRGTIEARFEAVVLGGAGIEVGVSLYPRPGAVARIAMAMDLDRPEMVAHEDLLAVTFDLAPRFAVLALEQAYGLTHLPVPIKRGGALEEVDLVVLGCVLGMLAEAAGGGQPHPEILDDGDGQLEISIEVPPILS